MTDGEEMRAVLQRLVTLLDQAVDNALLATTAGMSPRQRRTFDAIAEQHAKAKAILRAGP